MNIINQVSFKSIFTIENLKQFFIKYGHHWEKDYLRQVKSQISAFLNCGNIAFAKATFACDCGLVAYRPVTCKSRFCPSCAANSSTNWANALSDEFIEKKHRFILFSIHPKLEKFLFNHREIYGELSSIINKLFKNFFKYNSTVKKLKITDFGLISFIHTFGRSSNFNLHFHVILTEGGFDSKGKWHSVNFFPYQKFKDDWHNEVIKLLKRKFPNNINLKNMIKLCSNNDKHLFIDVKGKPVKNNKNLIKYLGRYLARPAIAEYRIISYDGKFIKFWYKDVETKEKEILELPLFEFMFRIIQHIPPKNLKLVRRYGIYSRRIKKKLKEVLKTLKNSRLFNIKAIPWDKRIEKWQGKNPLVCPRCNKKMKLVSFEHKKYGIFNYGST